MTKLKYQIGKGVALVFNHLDSFEIVNMKILKKGQKGFTLVELVIVVAIAGLVGAAITATAFQVFAFSTQTSNQMTAIRQVQQAGFWVSPDVMMSETVTPGASGGFPLTLNWTDLASNKVHGVVYTLEGTGTVKTLQRKHYIDGTLDSTTTIAQYINPTGTTFVPSGSAYSLTVTATVGGQTETRTYEVRPRIGT
jgi:prepilin-type N-terminal cleavage/methylation domain-containing protein